MAEGKELAKKQVWYMVGATAGGILLGMAAGALLLAPYMEKKKKEKEEQNRLAAKGGIKK